MASTTTAPAATEEITITIAIPLDVLREIDRPAAEKAGRGAS